MGVVFRAHDERLERDVAVKVLPAGTLADEAARKRFRREALSLSQLNHPNIATIYDFDGQDGMDFLVMEYIEGTTLDHQMGGGALSEKEIARLGSQLADGLTAAHERGVVHRDLKPANLRLTLDGRLKILDFGLAKLLARADIQGRTESLSQTEAAAGTLPYMAPEQLLGEKVDARADLYAAGALLYEMAAGRRPFPETQSSRLSDAILHQPPVTPRALNPQLSPQLEFILLKCLEKNPDQRYQSAREMGVDLRRLASASSAAPLPPLRRQAWRRPVIVGAAAVALLATLVLLDPGGWRERVLGRPATNRINSLAVLPLQNLSRNPAEEYFSDGMTEELISELANISALRVVSRTSVMHYKGRDEALPQIARELNVDAVVEGSVLRSGDKVRITVQLIRGADDKHLWARSYERDLRDVLALQADVSREIAAEINATLTPSEKGRIASSRTVNPAAHEAYLKGLYYWNKFTDNDMRKALEYFRQAVAQDPGYAPAYVGLADAYHELAYSASPPTEVMPKAEAAIRKALELDNTSADAHATLGWIVWRYDWDFPGAEKEFKRALDLDPNGVKGPAMYADFLDSMGRVEEGLRQHARALELDPLSLIGNSNLGDAYYVAREYDKAIEQYKKTLEIDEHFAGAHYGLVSAYHEKAMDKESVSELKEALKADGDEELAEVLVHAYTASGYKGMTKAWLAKLEERASHSYVEPTSIANFYTTLGDRDRAFVFLEKAYEERDPGLTGLKVDPGWDNLRSDPRFADLVRRMGLPE